MDGEKRSTHDRAVGSTADAVGKGVGGVAGVAAGAAIGSVAGPVGTVIGGVAGAVGGWWAGKEVADAATSYNDVSDAEFQTHFTGLSKDSRGRLKSYEQARPAYEEVVVSKHAVEEKRNVEGDVRKEKVDIKKSGRTRDTDTDMPAR